MAKYTIEDIEILRQKSGISYEEAVNLLEYHNGSLARALVDLEKNGRLKDDTAAGRQSKQSRNFLETLFQLRFVVKKDKTIIINLSSLFMLAALLMAAHICVLGLITALVLGYHISIINDRKENVWAPNSTDQSKPGNGTPCAEKHYAEKPASGTRPVNVRFPNEGPVDVRDDGDGYHEADIQ